VLERAGEQAPANVPAPTLDLDADTTETNP
jgi:hypothetical protein